MLSKFSVKKPLTVIVASILITILGVISFSKMTTDLLPSIDLPYVIVMTTYPGASPEKVESTATKPLEQVLATTTGIKDINSLSRENSSMIMLEFEQGINMDSIIIEMSSKIDLVKGYLPSEVSSPMFMKLNPDMLPIMVAAVDYDGKDIKEISHYVEDVIMPEFEMIDGVASVDGSGIVEESIKIQLNDEKINEINNNILATVDSKLAQAEREFINGQKKIKEGKELLEKESKIKTEELVITGITLQEGKNALESALSDLPKAKKELEGQLATLKTQRDALGELISFLESAGLNVSQELRETLNQVNKGIKVLEEAIVAIETSIPELEGKLNSLKDAQLQLEVGKLTLTRELTKASVSLERAEEELNKAYNDFQKTRDEALKNAGISSYINKDTISKILMAENFSMPAGYIIEGNNQILVKVGEEFKDKEEIENLKLFGDVKLIDIATVEFIDNSQSIYAKINGNDGVLLSFQKQSTASTAVVSDKINERIEELENEDSKLHITALQDQGVYINIVVNSVLNNLILGGILAVIILFLFLRNIKPTFIIALSIPISLLFAITMMYFSKVTMNIISLAGLALGVGMLVDNSIVVIENIYRLRNEGESIKIAAVKGASQVGGAIVASTLTTICVFLPIVFTEGISRQLFTDMGLTIAYSLIASLIVALTLVPTISSKMLTNIDEKKHGLFDRFVDFYEGILVKALKHRVIVLSSVAILLVLSIVGVFAKGMILMPEMDSPQISISMTMEKGTEISEIREMSNNVVDKLAQIDDIETIGVMESGNSMMGSGSGDNMSFYILLKDNKKNTSQEIAKEIEDITKDLNCELSISSSNMDMSALGGSGIEVIIKGDNLDNLKSIAVDISKIVEETKGTIDISNGIDESTKELKVKVDKNKAMEYNLTVAQVYQEVASAIKTETSSTTLSLNSKDYPIIIVNDEDENIKKEGIKDYTFTVNVNGVEEEVKLNDIATITEEDSLNSINRQNGVRTISVKAGVHGDYNVGLVSDEIVKKLNDYAVPSGYSVEIGGEKESMDSTYKDLFSMILLAIVFIYGIMVAQFQSFISPFIVLFTIPLAFTGGMLALLLTGFNMSMIAMLGFLVLAGVVVNNGIVFVDYVNQLRLEGMEKHDALVLAGRTRIRPILMTALTTILGLSTLAFAIGMGADMIQPMAIVTIGGLVYATLLTLIVVPVIYDMIHKNLPDVNIDIKN